MSPLIPAVGGALLVFGLIGVIAGLRRTAPPPAAPRRLGGARSRWRHISRQTQLLLAAGLLVGSLVALTSGWLVAVVLTPVALAGLPVLLGASPSGRAIKRLEAMEEWTRSLAGVLTVGIGLEEALAATLRSTPEPIRSEVHQLVARLGARWSTEQALRRFADDLNDTTGDLIAANLILGARRRGSGLASVLESLAESVAADVRARRAIEADRAKPRATARWVTIITVVVLTVLALTGSYVRPYTSPLGQVILLALLALYAAVLVWMRAMTSGSVLPRFLGAAHRRAEP